MGKSLVSQARGRGGPTYRVRRKAYSYKISYPIKSGSAKILSLIHSAGHTAPLVKLLLQNEIFYLPAFNNAIVGKEIMLGGEKIEEGNIIEIKHIPIGTHIFNIERNPGDGGKFIRSSGSSAVVLKKHEYNKVSVMLPSKKEIILTGECRATIGTIAGEGRKLKPVVKAGRKHYKMKARGKLWPRTSAVKMNPVDHPFGSGRGKRIKSKIAKRNAPPGKKVGHIRPRRTGRRK